MFPMTNVGAGKLLFNHLDAWVVSMAVAVAALTVHGRLAFDTLPIVLAVGIAYWLAFALNDYFDAPYDSQDDHKARGNYFTQGFSSYRWFWVVAAVLLGMTTFILGRFGMNGAIVMVVGALVAWVYSAPPIRLKARPGLDVLTHALFVESFPYVAVVLLLGVAWTTLDLFILGVLFLGSLTAQLEQQLRDFDLDRLTGRTFATVAGRRVTYGLLVMTTVTLLVVAAVFYLRGSVPLYLVPYGLIPLPALLHRLVRGPDQPRSPALVAVTAFIALLYTVWLVVSQMLPSATV